MNNKSIIIKGVKFTTGDSVTCFIQNNQITDAKIYIESENYNDYAVVYICQNIKDGDTPDDGDCLGYRYSWISEVKESENMNQGVSDLRKVNNDIFESVLLLAFPIKG